MRLQVKAAAECGDDDAELDSSPRSSASTSSGAAPAEPYSQTEEHIRTRRARGLFADMRFTMARPRGLLPSRRRCSPNAKTVVSAALCYYADEPERPAGDGRLPRYTWYHAYAELREKLDALGRRLGGDYRVLVDENDHVDREGAARSGVGFYGKNTMLITRTPRLLGRTRHARHRRRDRALAATRARLRLLPALYRRLPHRARSTSPARSTRLAASPTGARRPARFPEEYRAELGSPGVRLRHLPGRLPVEPRDREAPRGTGSTDRRGAARLARRVARGLRRAAPRPLRAALLPAKGSALSAPKRSHRGRKPGNRRASAPPSRRTPRAATRCCASMRSGHCSAWKKRLKWSTSACGAGSSSAGSRSSA